MQNREHPVSVLSGKEEEVTFQECYLHLVALFCDQNSLILLNRYMHVCLHVKQEYMYLCLYVT